MKQIRSILCLILFASIVQGQSLEYEYTLTFEDPSYFNHIIIPNNKWQIGAPQKNLFTSAYSPTNVIVTDKTNSYPINDTSIFIIKNIANQGFLHLTGTAQLSGKYFVNSDTLVDFGKIEFSPNNGLTWINLLNSTTYSSSIQWGEKPTLTGNSFGWQNFNVDIHKFGSLFNIQEGDTILYKFSFISDNIQTNKDGLMYDDIRFLDFMESIPEIQNDNLISIFPNPASDIITIHEIKKGSRPKIEIFDFTGHLVFVDKKFSGQSISTKALPSGVYFLKYSDSNSYATKKIVVRH
jgi:hypothetical protein